jgi:hypothetical protein
MTGASLCESSRDISRAVSRGLTLPWTTLRATPWSACAKHRFGVELKQAGRTSYLPRIFPWSDNQCGEFVTLETGAEGCCGDHSKRSFAHALIVASEVIHQSAACGSRKELRGGLLSNFGTRCNQWAHVTALFLFLPHWVPSGKGCCRVRKMLMRTSVLVVRCRFQHRHFARIRSQIFYRPSWPCEYLGGFDMLVA